jgi:hypothetical protein
MEEIQIGVSHILGRTGELATKAKPGLLDPYRRANPGCHQTRPKSAARGGSEEQLLREVRQTYSGKIIAGHDLDLY